MPRLIRSLATVCALALVLAGSAAADWGGSDPPRNTPLGTLPSACSAAPAGPQCVNAGVYYLDKARKKVGLPPYALPANFTSLSPPRQLFILVNLDRIQYGLPPIPGMTAALNHDALASGVWRADDPHLSNATGITMWWPGWAGAFDNAPMAYEGWVWDDGLGSNNPRCTPTDHSRCWGHRHSVLWKFGANAVLAMGVAAGRDAATHHRGYAYLFVGGSSAYKPKYTYTWSQAVADGAGTNQYDPGTPVGCVVPNVLEMMLSGATRSIEKAHCTVGTVLQEHSKYPDGFVIAQHPAPYTTRPKDSRIRLVVSLGPSR